MVLIGEKKIYLYIIQIFFYKDDNEKYKLLIKLVNIFKD